MPMSICENSNFVLFISKMTYGYVPSSRAMITKYADEEAARVQAMLPHRLAQVVRQVVQRLARVVLDLAVRRITAQPRVLDAA